MKSPAAPAQLLEKLGFRLVARRPHPALQERSELWLTLEDQAKSAGIPPERAGMSWSCAWTWRENEA